MAKRIIWAVAAVFIAWSTMDFILHGVLLRSTYEATAKLWRPADQMNMPLMYLSTLIFITCFVLIYGLLVGKKSVAAGLQFGALFGLGTGISMAIGSYCTMPIPFTLALSWFAGSVIESIIAGAITGAIVKA